jgi:hypothetical protein
VVAPHQRHPGLTLAQVYAALAFFYEHREEIISEIEADRAAVGETDLGPRLFNLPDPL